MTLAFAAALVAAMLFAPASAAAQKPAGTLPAPAVSAPDSAVEAHARLHLALNALRDKEQVELAEPKNKKPDLQADIRQRYRALRADSIKAHGSTAEQFAAMTQRISGDDALRIVFEATLERLSKR